MESLLSGESSGGFCLYWQGLICCRRLVATLGSKSNLKKINRKAILDVNIPKACQTVSDPGAPMALRLQSNLLLAVLSFGPGTC